jgi:ferredoxin
MKVEADLDRCQGYGNCAITAPELFSVDPATDQVSIRAGLVDSADEEIVREAIRDCPTGALRLEEVQLRRD